MKKKGESYGVPFEEILLHEWKDPKRAKLAVEVALEDFREDNDIDALLNILRLVAEAQGGLTKLARKTSLSRQALHEALSSNGNPRLRTFKNVIESLGLRISIEPLKSRTKLARAA
jgi:probable addiction module antidote protein